MSEVVRWPISLPVGGRGWAPKQIVPILLYGSAQVSERNLTSRLKGGHSPSGIQEEGRDHLREVSEMETQDLFFPELTLCLLVASLAIVYLP